MQPRQPERPRPKTRAAKDARFDEPMPWPEDYFGMKLYGRSILSDPIPQKIPKPKKWMTAE